MLAVLTLCMFGCNESISSSRAGLVAVMDETAMSDFFDSNHSDLETAAAHIYTDSLSLKQENSGKAEYLVITYNENEDNVRRQARDCGLSGDAANSVVRLITKSYVQKIVWNNDDSIDFYMSDAHTVLKIAEFLSGQEDSDIKVYEMGNNWFFFAYPNGIGSIN